MIHQIFKFNFFQKDSHYDYNFKPSASSYIHLKKEPIEILKH